MVTLTTRQKAAVLTVLQRVGSWTNARWDQHIMYDVGDEDADAIRAWAHEQLGPGTLDWQSMPAHVYPAGPDCEPECAVCGHCEGQDPVPWPHTLGTCVDILKADSRTAWDVVVKCATNSTIAAAAREYVARVRRLEDELGDRLEPDQCAPEWVALIAAVEGKP